MTQKLCFLICPDRIYDDSWRCHLPTWDFESLLECFEVTIVTYSTEDQQWPNGAKWWSSDDLFGAFFPLKKDPFYLTT